MAKLWNSTRSNKDDDKLVCIANKRKSEWKLKAETNFPISEMPCKA